MLIKNAFLRLKKYLLVKFKYLFLPLFAAFEYVNIHNFVQLENVEMWISLYKNHKNKKSRLLRQLPIQFLINYYWQQPTASKFYLYCAVQLALR